MGLAGEVPYIERPDPNVLVSEDEVVTDELVCVLDLLSRSKDLTELCLNLRSVDFRSVSEHSIK